MRWKSHLYADGSIASLESGDNITKKKNTNQTIEAYELWIMDRWSIDWKTFRKNNKYFIKLQIDKRKKNLFKTKPKNLN